MAKVLADLPESVLSRSEEFLNVMVGRSQDLNSLPVPQSRIEEYLEYLAYNKSVGGGGGNSFNDFEQEVGKIDFKSGGVVVKTMQIATSQEISSILSNLT